MTQRTVVLAYVWLGLVLLGGLLIAGIIVALATQDFSGDAGWAALFLVVLAVALGLFWVMPLAIAVRLTLRRQAWGWRVFVAHTALGSLVWLLISIATVGGAVGAIRDRIAHGPNWGGYPEGPISALLTLALLGLSIYTFAALLRDNPRAWEKARQS